MIQAICIDKIKDKNKVIGYNLKYDNGTVEYIDKKELKFKILSKKINVRNLTLTTNNRLISKQLDRKYYTDDEIYNMVRKSKMLGLPITELPQTCGSSCYVISKSEKEHVLLIPSTVTKIRSRDGYIDDLTRSVLYTYTENITGRLKVIGGSGLIDAKDMFNNVHCDSLDFSNFDTFNIQIMKDMFTHCHAVKLDLTSFDISSLINMDGMFYNNISKEIDLSSFNLGDRHVSARGLFMYSGDVTIKIKDKQLKRYFNSYTYGKMYIIEV